MKKISLLFTTLLLCIALYSNCFATTYGYVAHYDTLAFHYEWVQHWPSYMSKYEYVYKYDWVDYQYASWENGYWLFNNSSTEWYNGDWYYYKMHFIVNSY